MLATKTFAKGHGKVSPFANVFFLSFLISSRSLGVKGQEVYTC